MLASHSSYNQPSGNGVNTDLRINRVETAVGSGLQSFADFQVSAVTRFRAGNLGSITGSGKRPGDRHRDGELHRDGGQLDRPDKRNIEQRDRQLASGR